jgi:DNA topoisomerase-1
MASEWILREGSKRTGFRYRVEGGGRVTDRATLERIDALRIPPAWTNVHVATSPRAAVQAWGMDARGRKQYRYHDSAVARGQLRKYYRVRRLAHDLPAIRAAIGADFARPELDRRRVTAAVVRLISQGFFRVGGERYAEENKTFGITTLRKRHLAVDGDMLVFTYVGKRSVRQRQAVVDGQLARFAEELLAVPGTRLFRYREGGRWHDLTARDVNAYLHETLGVPYTAKDFRTWGGTLRAATVLAELGPAATPRQASQNVLTAVRLVAAELGNTPAICRASYVHPIVIARYLDAGEVIRPERHRAPRRHERSRHAPEERALIAFLDRHFPERRRRRAAAPPRPRERRQHADAA